MLEFAFIRSRRVLASFTFLAAFTAPAGAATEAPFYGTPFAIPGSFEAEDFDRGGEGVAYHDNVPGNAGGQYRPNEDVDIIVSSDPAGGGYVVNNFETGEWLNYTVNAQTATNYDIELRVSSQFSASAFHIEIDGQNVTGSVVVPNTGNWNSFQWVGKKGVALSAGLHVLRIFADQQYFNLNSVRVLQSTTSNAPPPPAPVTRYEETDPSVTFSAGWIQDNGWFGWSGGNAMESQTPGAQATFAFTGTSVAWLGMRGPDAGIARVYIDGSFVAEVDLYYSDPRIQAILFTSPALADGNHTITIEATGLKNPASSGTLVVVDAIDVMRPGTRFEETEPAVSYAGSWVQGNLNRAWSLGTAAETGVAGASVTFTFTGTEVSWIGCRKLSTGIADVYLDGVFQTEIDTFQAPPIEGYQHTMFTASGLANGTHTLTIVVTGRTNPAAFNNLIVIDAFDVRP